MIACLRFSLLILIAAFVYSCNTLYNVKTIDIEIVEPGSIQLPAKYKTLAVRYNNCNVAPNSDFQNFASMENLLTDSLNTDSIASEIYFGVSVQSLTQQNFFDSIIEIKKQDFSQIALSDTNRYNFALEDSLADIPLDLQNFNVYLFSTEIGDLKRTKPANKLKYLHPEYALYTPTELQHIADSSKADLLLSMDYYAAEDGVVYNEDLNLARETVIVNSIWNFYDLKKQQFIRCMPRQESIHWQNYVPTKSGLEHALPPRWDAVLTAAEISATRFADYLIPHWIEVKRMYYISGHIEFKQTEALIEQGKWLEAAKIWKEQANNKNKAIAAKSKFNMALACEMQGNLDAALAWVVESFHVFGQKNKEHYYNCNEYIRILGQRKWDLKKLQQQFGEQNQSSSLMPSD